MVHIEIKDTQPPKYFPPLKVDDLPVPQLENLLKAPSIFDPDGATIDFAELLRTIPRVPLESLRSPSPSPGPSSRRSYLNKYVPSFVIVSLANSRYIAQMRETITGGSEWIDNQDDRN